MNRQNKAIKRRIEKQHGVRLRQLICFSLRAGIAGKLNQLVRFRIYPPFSSLRYFIAYTNRPESVAFKLEYRRQLTELQLLQMK